MKRVLVTGGTNIGKAGVATIVYKWGQSFDSDEVVYDYLMQRGLPDEPYQKAIKEKGGVIYTRAEGIKNLYAVVKWVENIIRDNKYEILHINSDSAYIATAYIYAAKKNGLKNIYVHSHCTEIDDLNRIRRFIKTVLHKLCRPYVCNNTKCFLACSKLAGIWMFGKKNVEKEKYHLIYNGVEVNRYLFDKEIRKKYREELGIENKFVLANIGRFSYQKNQEFLIRVFAKYKDENPESMLILVGDGENSEILKKMVNEYKVQESVLFLGRRSDVNRLLSAFDVLVMPSRFEGLPVTMVEAQMASLPCVVSDRITKEAQFTENVIYVEGDDIDSWIKAIKTLDGLERKTNSNEKYKSKFNINIAAKELQNILKG